MQRSSDAFVVAFIVILLIVVPTGCDSSDRPIAQATPQPALTSATHGITAEAQIQATETPAAQPNASAAVATPTPMAQPTTLTQTTTSTPATPGRRVYSTLDEIVLKSGGTVQIRDNTAMTPDLLDRERDFGVKPVAGKYQRMTVGDVPGAIFYYEFGSDSEATHAFANIRSNGSLRGSILQYGKFVVQTLTRREGDGEAFRTDVERTLDGN